MPRRVKDFIDISEFTSLDTLIRYLETIRDNLPGDCEAQIRIRGDDIFGKRLTVTYLREQTAEEVELEARYADAAGDAAERTRLEALQRQLDQLPYHPDRPGDPDQP